MLGFATARLVGVAGLPLLDAMAGVAVTLGMMWLAGVVRAGDIRRLCFDLMNKSTPSTSTLSHSA